MDMDPLKKAAETSVSPEELLAQQKELMYKDSLEGGRIESLGILAGDSDKSLWPGAISLQARLDSGELNESLVHERSAELGKYFVPAGSNAAVRCIDGSTIQGYDDADPRWFGRAIGPQIQGGTLGEAVAWRMWHGAGKVTTLVDDVQQVAKLPYKYAAGAHTDDKMHADTDTHAERSGCGQYDGQHRKLIRYADPAYAEAMRTISQTILGTARQQSEGSSFDRLQQSAAALAGRSDYFASAHEAVSEILRLNPHGIETVVRPHNEVSLTINFVPGTTFHRDHYNAGSNAQIQNFGLDAWYIMEKYGQEGYALVVDAVATAMDLTDGSLLLFARLPRD